MALASSRHGARARDNVESAKADAANARQQYERAQTLIMRLGISQQDLDSARAALDVAQAKAVVRQKALDLAVIGPRQEDIAQAEVQLRANQAQLAFARQQLVGASALRFSG